MKSLKVLAILCLAILLVSCEESEAELIDVSENDLTGVWNLTKLSQEGSIRVSGIPVPIPVTSEGSDYDAIIEITQSPNSFTAKGSFTNTAIIDNPIGDDIIDIRTINLNEFVANGNWTVSDGVITVSQASLDQDIDIKKFDGNTLELEFEVEVPVLFQGTNFVSKSTFDMTLTK